MFPLFYVGIQRAATPIREQATKIRAAHDEIKVLRDASK